MKDLCDSKEATKERDEKFLRVYQALYGSKQNHRIKKSADWNGEFPVLFCDSQHQKVRDAAARKNIDSYKSKDYNTNCLNAKNKDWRIA